MVAASLRFSSCAWCDAMPPHSYGVPRVNGMQYVQVAAVATVNDDPQAVAAMELLREGAMPLPNEIREAAPRLDLRKLLASH